MRPACATSVGERQQMQSSAASTSLNVRERESERTAVIEKENVKPWLLCSSSRSSSTTGLSGGETCLEENKISHVHLKQQRQTVETCWRSVPSPMGANVWQQQASHSHTGRVIREKVGFFFFFASELKLFTPQRKSPKVAIAFRQTETTAAITRTHPRYIPVRVNIYYVYRRVIPLRGLWALWPRPYLACLAVCHRRS